MFSLHLHRKSTSPAIASPLLIRPAADSDARALERLAQLDAARVPAGPTLVAEVGGELVAAYGIAAHERIGDPFRPTSQVLDLLEHRARHGVPYVRAA